MQKIKYCLHFFYFFVSSFRGLSDIVCVEKFFAQIQMAGFGEKTQKVLLVCLVTIKGIVMKTALIHNGATPCVIGVDLPYHLQDFFSQDEFTFCPRDYSFSIDISESMDNAVILAEKGLKK